MALTPKQIAELLLTCPDCLEPLVQTGVAALETYGRFIDDCVAATMAFGNATANDGLSCRLMVPPGMIGGTVPEWLMRARSMRWCRRRSRRCSTTAVSE